MAPTPNTMKDLERPSPGCRGTAAAAKVSMTGTPLAARGEERRPRTAEEVVTRWTCIFALCAAINSVSLGFDIGVSVETGRLIQADLGLTQKQRELFIGSLNFWAIFGSLGAWQISDRYGRRLTFFAASVAFVAGTTCMVAADALPLLLVGRAFVGWAVGVGLVIDPLYIAEVTPASHRGELVTWSEIAISAGATLGFSSGWLVSTVMDTTNNNDSDHFAGLAQWRIMLLLGLVPPLLMMVACVTVMAESPRWLIAHGHTAQATAVLEKMYAADQHYRISTLIREIHTAHLRDQQTSLAAGWSFLFQPSPAVRRMLVLGVGAAVAQQLVGIDAIQYYLGDVIANSGIATESRQNLLLMLLGLLKLAFAFTGGKIFDHAGRRTGLTVSLLGMAVALVVVAAAFAHNGPYATGAVLAGLALYLSFFSMGMGPGAWLIPSEVFANTIRAKAVAVATGASRVVSTVTASTFLTLVDWLGWTTVFLMLATVCVLVCVFFLILLPETKGKSLEDMSFYFAEVTNDTSFLEQLSQHATPSSSPRTSRRLDMGELEPLRKKTDPTGSYTVVVVEDDTLTTTDEEASHWSGSV